MRSLNMFVKGVILMSDKVIVVPILSKVLGMAILDFLLIACLLIGNY